eukprot:225191-Amphidinium_carterae.1
MGKCLATLVVARTGCVAIHAIAVPTIRRVAKSLDASANENDVRTDIHHPEQPKGPKLGLQIDEEYKRFVVSEASSQ